MFSTCPSVHPSVRPSIRRFLRPLEIICDRQILKPNEPTSVQTGTQLQTALHG